MGVNVITTSLFGTLSVYLAEATNDTKYIDHAKASFEFVRSSLFLDDPNIPTDGMSLTDCNANNWVFSHDSVRAVYFTVSLSTL